MNKVFLHSKTRVHTFEVFAFHVLQLRINSSTKALVPLPVRDPRGNSLSVLNNQSWNRRGCKCDPVWLNDLASVIISPAVHQGQCRIMEAPRAGVRKPELACHSPLCASLEASQTFNKVFSNGDLSLYFPWHTLGELVFDKNYIRIEGTSSPMHALKSCAKPQPECMEEMQCQFLTVKNSRVVKSHILKTWSFFFSEYILKGKKKKKTTSSLINLTAENYSEQTH